MEIINNKTPNQNEENSQPRCCCHKGSKPRALWYGIAIIACGVIWLAANAGVIDYSWRRVLIAWPMILVVVGMGELLAKNTTAGVILLAVGLFFELPRLGDALTIYNNFFDNITRNWWPLLLILAGILIIIRLSRRGNTEPWRFSTTAKVDIDAVGGISIQETFSGSKRVFSEEIFHGGSIKAVFGGVDLDLRAASLPAGETVLYIETVFGGVNLLAPSDWNIEIRSQSSFGGFEDKRRFVQSADNSSKLIIVANCTFGGGDIQ